MDDGRPTKAGVLATMPDSQRTGNRTLAIIGYVLWQGGFVVFSFMLLLALSRPSFSGENWTLLWFGVLAIAGLVLIRVNRKALEAPTKGRRFLGQILAQLGMALSLGFIYWVGDIPLLGIAFLVGSVALFTVGMLIALDKNAVDDSR